MTNQATTFDLSQAIAQTALSAVNASSVKAEIEAIENPIDDYDCTLGDSFGVI